MTLRRPRTKPPEERRDELMNAAQRLFLEHGVGATSIEQITDGADVAKGTFYLHFKSKDDVLFALRQRFVRELFANIENAIAQQRAKDWKRKLGAWAAAGTAGYLDAAALHNIVFYEFQAPLPKKDGDNIIIAHLAELLEAGSDARAWSVEDPEFTANFLFHGLHGVVHDALAKQKRVARSALIRKVQQMYFRAVGLRSD
jgi:AcrR family transcriptional regulator